MSKLSLEQFSQTELTIQALSDEEMALVAGGGLLSVLKKVVTNPTVKKVAKGVGKALGDVLLG